MAVSTYQSSYCGIDQWTDIFYQPEPATSASKDAWTAAAALSDLPAGLRRRAEFYRRELILPDKSAQRRSFSSPVMSRPKRLSRPMCNSYNPFTSRELPRGKFCGFPTPITRMLPKPPDPLGFTSHGLVPEVAHREFRGRASGFPSGGYPVMGAPVIHQISQTEDAPAPWREYAELERNPRGRASRRGIV
eukprot:s1324_g20.t1